MSLPIEACFWDLIQKDFRWEFMGVKFKFDELPLEIHKMKDNIKSYKILFHGDFYGDEIYTEVMNFYNELKQDVINPVEFKFDEMYNAFLRLHLKEGEEEYKCVDNYEVLPQY